MRRIAFAALFAAMVPALISLGAVEAAESGYSFDDGVLAVTDRGGAGFALTGVSVLRFEPAVSMQFGFFRFARRNREVEALELGERDGSVALFRHGGQVGGIGFSRTGAGSLEVELRVGDELDASALRLEFACGSDHAFWGFGEQYNFVDLRGRKFPVWVSEQGVGRREVPVMPFHGTLTDSYFPMPYFMDPKAGRALLMLNTEYMEFDLCAGAGDTWSVEVWNPEWAAFMVIEDETPAAVVSRLTEELGRPERLPPDWAFAGVWLAAQGGIDAVRQRLDLALEAGVPVTALWVQDWLGQRHFGAGNYGVKHRWVHDEDFYPGLDEYIAEINEKGVRFLGYFNSFIAEDYEHYIPARDKGYAIKRPDGEIYKFLIITFEGSLLDLTNPEAVEWFQGYARKATEMGIQGWMADYGEWLPYDARLHAGDARSVHNLYPKMWHEANRRVLDDAYPDGDYVMFTRSGYTGSHRVTQILWAGDQEAEWCENDGIPTVVTAGLTMGLSGIPFFTHDIAGFSGGPSDKELFLRWTELGAFTPFMRTHDGLQKGRNHRFDSDEETLAHFVRFGLVHRELAPYFISVAGEAVDTGLPIIRHTILVDPDWDRAYEAHGQWMLGRDMVFVPVVEEGGERVTALLPSGEWEHLFTGERFQGRQAVDVDAPIGAPAVFFRAGTLDPTAAAVRRVWSGE